MKEHLSAQLNGGSGRGKTGHKIMQSSAGEREMKLSGFVNGPQENSHKRASGLNTGSTIIIIVDGSTGPRSSSGYESIGIRSK